MAQTLVPLTQALWGNLLPRTLIQTAKEALLEAPKEAPQEATNPTFSRERAKLVDASLAHIGAALQ